jgi:uncharacterized membrane protein
MKVTGFVVASLVVIAAMALAGWWALGLMPPGATLPVHWNAAGEADRFSPARQAVWIMPGVTFVFCAVLAIIPRIEPLQDKLAESAPVLRIAWASLLALLVLAQAMIVAPAFGWHIAGALPMLGVGLMFIALGNVLPKSRPGFFVGIRTPWTILDTDNWIATHRLGGRLFLVAGAAIALTALPIVPGGVRIAVVLGASLLAAGVPMAYSWWLWRQAGSPKGR